MFLILPWFSGIAGEGALEEARVDMVADCCEDIVKPLIDIYMEKSDTAKVGLYCSTFM